MNEKWRIADHPNIVSPVKRQFPFLIQSFDTVTL